MKRQNRTIDLLEREKYFLPEEKEIIEYGIKQGKIILTSVMATLLIGMIFGVLWHSIILLVSFIPLRMYAGGYHADTQLRCSILSSIIITFGFWLLSIFTLSSKISIVLVIVSFFLIFFLSPVENDNKYLDEIEKYVYRMKTRNILMSETVLILITIISEQRMIFNTMTFSLLLISISLILGKLKYTIKK